jgi:hypothetical protein
MSQQERKVQEGEVVRRLTFGAGAAALGLAGYFTVSAATAGPVAFGSQPAADVQPVPAAGMQEISEKYFVRRVHVAPVRPPAGGVKAAGQAPAAAVVAQPLVPAQPAPAQPAPAVAPAPAAKPVATTGATPVK